MDKTLKYIVDNVRVCVDGQVRIMPTPKPAADASRPIALAALLKAIDTARTEKRPTNKVGSMNTFKVK